MIQELPKRNWGGEKLIESFLQNERDIKVLGRIAVERLNFEHQRGSLHSMGKRWASKRVTGHWSAPSGKYRWVEPGGVYFHRRLSQYLRSDLPLGSPLSPLGVEAMVR